MGVPGSQDCFAGVAPPACDATARTVRVTWQHTAELEARESDSGRK